MPLHRLRAWDEHEGVWRHDAPDEAAHPPKLAGSRSVADLNSFLRDLEAQQALKDQAFAWEGKAKVRGGLGRTSPVEAAFGDCLQALVNPRQELTALFLCHSIHIWERTSTCKRCCSGWVGTFSNLHCPGMPRHGASWRLTQLGLSFKLRGQRHSCSWCVGVPRLVLLRRGGWSMCLQQDKAGSCRYQPLRPCPAAGCRALWSTVGGLLI